MTSNPLVQSLAENGGPTKTMAIPSNSPAVNAGSSCTSTDQRGYARVGNCDIGAFEYGGTAPGPIITTPGNTLTGISEGVKEAILIYPNPSKGDFTITFEKSVSDEIFIYNAQGINVSSLKVKGDSCIIQGLSKGLYFLVFKDANVYKKVIVE